MYCDSVLEFYMSCLHYGKVLRPREENQLEKKRTTCTCTIKSTIITTVLTDDEVKHNYSLVL